VSVPPWIAGAGCECCGHRCRPPQSERVDGEVARARHRVGLPARGPEQPGQKLQTWWISYYIDGKRKRESSKSRKKSEAQALLKRRMGEYALGLEIGDEAKRLTFEDLEAGFRRSYENSGRRSLRRAGNAWDRLREHFGGWKARAITANALESYAAERLKEAAPATVQYELAVLRRAMTLAVKKGQLRSRPHFPHVGVHNARTGFFTREEMEKIATEIGPELGNLVRVAFSTGWRRGELLTLKWADVDWEAGVLRLRPTSTIAGTMTKNNEGRVFPFRRQEPHRFSAMSYQNLYRSLLPSGSPDYRHWRTYMENRYRFSPFRTRGLVVGAPGIGVAFTIIGRSSRRAPPANLRCGPCPAGRSSLA
jgi:hypothetical protein